jgi:hypothetical protein
MQATDAREGNDAPAGFRFDRARDGRIAVEGHMWAVLVVVARVLPDQAKEVALTELVQ